MNTLECGHCECDESRPFLDLIRIQIQDHKITLSIRLFYDYSKADSPIHNIM